MFWRVFSLCFGFMELCFFFVFAVGQRGAEPADRARPGTAAPARAAPLPGVQQQPDAAHRGQRATRPQPSVQALFSFFLSFFLSFCFFSEA